MNVKKIVKEYLEKNGYDGLYSVDDCACEVSDLMPCEEMGWDCTAGYKFPCDCGEHDFHIGEKDDLQLRLPGIPDPRRWE